jgi:hypothetical protein
MAVPTPAENRQASHPVRDFQPDYLTVTVTCIHG